MANNTPTKYMVLIYGGKKNTLHIRCDASIYKRFSIYKTFFDNKELFKVSDIVANSLDWYVPIVIPVSTSTLGDFADYLRMVPPCAIYGSGISYMGIDITSSRAFSLYGLLKHYQIDKDVVPDFKTAQVSDDIINSAKIIVANSIKALDTNEIKTNPNRTKQISFTIDDKNVYNNIINNKYSLLACVNIEFRAYVNIEFRNADMYMTNITAPLIYCADISITADLIRF